LNQKLKLKLLVYFCFSDIDLSKYGKFKSQELFGCKLNMCYEISKDGKLSPFTPIESDQGSIEAGEEDSFEAVQQIIHSEDQPTNQTIFDSNTSQKLSHQEILGLRDSGKSVISELIQNSSTFEQKNSFSKVKYIQRKQKKFARWIRVLPINSRNLCNHFIEREPQKVLDLRLDTVGQILNLANVQYGGKYLVMDDTKGLLLGAIIERCSSVKLEYQKSQVLLVHEEDCYNGHIMRMFNFDSNQLSVFYDIHVRDCLPKVLESIPWVPAHTDPEKLRLYADKIEARRLNYIQKQDRRLMTRSILDAKNFTSIILAVEPGAYTTESLVDSWLPFLQPGGAFVIYSSSKEALNSSFFEALVSEKFIDVRITEGFLRPYQTAEGRLHPMMNCNGHGGFLLTMIKSASANNNN
jgi:tRNA (adenine58-N1)-methyltransferase non-catalytic subunit